MTYYEEIKQMSFDEMVTFVVKQIHSECSGFYDEWCKEEGYKNCQDCVEKMLSREVK